MEIQKEDTQKEINEELNQLENLFSNLIIDLEQIQEIKSENNNELKIEKEKEREDIIAEKEVENNIKDINENYPSKINRRHHFAITDKLDAIEYLKKGNSIHKTAEKFMVDRKTIKYWRDHEKEYKKVNTVYFFLSCL